MSVAFKQVRVYVRGAVVAALAIAIGIVLAMNRGHAVQFWFFGLTDDTKPVNVVWLMLCTAVASLVTWWALLLGWRLVREIREVKRERAIKRVTTTLEKRNAELNERERRIDEKLRRAIGDDEEEEVGE